ncbi:MAG: TetR/AcrR family transcriptional regulator [Pseudomonadota bacterium]
MPKASAGKTQSGSDGPQNKSALRRQREREQRYQTILKAAECCFARDGYNKASVEQIADEAEVSVGTVYFYFKNKEDLLIHLLNDIGFQLRDLLGREFRKADGSVEGMRRAGQVFFDEFCPHYPERLLIFFRDAVGQSAEVEAHRKKIFNRLILDVREALERLAVQQEEVFQSPLAAEVMAVSIMGMYERIAYHYLIWQEDRSKDLVTIGSDAVDFIVGGIPNLFKK